MWKHGSLADLLPFCSDETRPLIRMITRIEEYDSGRGFRRTQYYVGDGEKFLIEINSHPVERNNKHECANIWFKKKWIPRRLNQMISAHTYFTEDNMCRGWYNPTCKRSEDGGRQVVDFSWDYEDTMENRIAILAAAISMYTLDIKTN